MMVMEEKKNEKTLLASEKYSLSFIKNATLNNIKKDSVKESRDKEKTFNRKRSTYCNW